MGAGGAFLLGILRRKLDRKNIRSALLQATRTAAAVFTVLIGALLFGYFLTITQTPPPAPQIETTTTTSHPATTHRTTAAKVTRKTTTTTTGAVAAPGARRRAALGLIAQAMLAAR